MQLSAPALQ